MSYVGGAAAAAAIAAEAERVRQEEEEMTSYSPKGPGRRLGIQDPPLELRRVPQAGASAPILEQEKRGGWVLVEKFDDSRIRLKRPAGTKVVEDDFADGYDPYRTSVGTPSAAFIIAILVGFSLFLLLLFMSALLMR